MGRFILRPYSTDTCVGLMPHPLTADEYPPLASYLVFQVKKTSDFPDEKYVMEFYLERLMCAWMF